VTSAKVYTNSWAVHVEGGQEAARELARLHGFIYVDEVIFLCVHLCSINYRFFQYSAAKTFEKA